MLRKHALAVDCPAGAIIVRSPVSLRSTVAPRAQPRTASKQRQFSLVLSFVGKRKNEFPGGSGNGSSIPKKANSEHPQIRLFNVITSELLHRDHVVVHGLAAADVADLDTAAALGAHQIGRLFGVLVADVAAGNDRDELGVLLLHGAGQTIGHLDQVGAGGNDFAVLQRHDLALFDGLAVKLAVAGGIGDQTRADAVRRLHHGNGVLLRLQVGVKVQHGGHALGHGAGGQHDDLAVRELLRLLGRHDDVLVVGQNEHGLGRHALDVYFLFFCFSQYISNCFIYFLFYYFLV